MNVSQSDAALQLQQVTYKVIGAAMQVHNQLGPGLQEIAYHRGMSLALESAGLTFEDEKPIDVHFGDEWVGLLYIDHFVEGRLVEEKAFSHLLTNEEVAQVSTYLAAAEADVGLLINFGRARLEYKRILRPKKLIDWRDRARRYAWRPKTNANPLIRSTSADEGVS
jgi:GxxExxY protein